MSSSAPIRRASSCGLIAALIISVLAVAAFVSPAAAQDYDASLGDESVLETCSLYALILSTGGDTLIDAATQLKELAAPNPPGIDDALDTVIAAEDSQSSDADVVEAYSTLDGYYGGICEGIDQCPIVQAVSGDDQSLAMQAAELLRDLNRPNPPGIGIALQGITDPETDPDDFARFRAQVGDYFAQACSDGDDDGSDSGTTVEGGADEQPRDSGSDSDSAAGDADDADDTDAEVAMASDGTEPPVAEPRTNYASDGTAPTLPNTGFGTVGLFLAFLAFVAFTLGATLIAATDRS